MSDCNPEKDANPDASGQADEPIGDLKKTDSDGGEEKPTEDSKLGAPDEQKLMEDSKPGAPDEEKPLEDSKPDAINNAKTQIEEGNPVSSSSAHVEKVDPDTPDGKRVLKRDVKPVPSKLVQQENTVHPPDTVEIKTEVSSDISKETAVKKCEESSSAVAAGSTTDSSTEKPLSKDHVCTDACIHGGARPKTKSNANKPKKNPDESSSSPNESERVIEKLTRLMERMGRDIEQNPRAENIGQDWNEKLENANCLAEEFARPLGCVPVIQMPDSDTSPYLRAHVQLNRMFMCLSLDDKDKSEISPCIVSSHVLDDSSQEASHEQDNEETEQSGSVTEKSGLEDPKTKKEFNPAIALPGWQIPIDQNAQVNAEKQDPIPKSSRAEDFPKPDLEHEDEAMEVVEEMDSNERMEDVEERGQVMGVREPAEHPQPRQEYRLMRLAPGLPPINRMGALNPNPNHPYRERNLDLWRASMLTAYRSGRYHSPELLDHTLQQLEMEGISSEDFYRLYHSTRLIDIYRDDGIDEHRTFSELQDMALEDRINQVIIAVGYLTVAMLYMRLYAERNPEINESSSESSAVDSGNVDSLEPEPSVKYVQLREHVNIDLEECPENAHAREQNIALYKTLDIETPESNSPMDINSPENVDSPQGIQSPDIIVPLNSVESVSPNKDDPSNVLVPLKDVSKRSDTSSSRQSLLNVGDISDADSSASPGPSCTDSLKKDELKRKAILGSCRSLSMDSTSRDATPIPMDAANSQPRSGVVPRTVGELINMWVDVLLSSVVQGTEQGNGETEEKGEESSTNQTAGPSNLDQGERLVLKKLDSDGKFKSEENEGADQRKRRRKIVEEDEKESLSVEKEVSGEDQDEQKDPGDKRGDDDIDIQMEDAGSKTRKVKKRKDHSDSDDEFNLPKKPHIEN